MLQTTSKDKALSLLSKRGVHHAPLFSLTIALYLQYFEYFLNQYVSNSLKNGNKLIKQFNQPSLLPFFIFV